MSSKQSSRELFIECVLPRLKNLPGKSKTSKARGLMTASKHLGSSGSSSTSTSTISTSSLGSRREDRGEPELNQLEEELLQAQQDASETLPLADHSSIQIAQQQCVLLGGDNQVLIIEDEQVKEDVVELMGQEARVVFAVRNVFRYFVLFVKDLHRFFEFEIEVLDERQRYRVFHATNARSLARIEEDTCQLPICFESNDFSIGGNRPNKNHRSANATSKTKDKSKEKDKTKATRSEALQFTDTGGSWRYLCMDLQLLTMKAFGTRHVATVQVRIGGNCRVLRCFFQDELYRDNELPSHLTFLG